MAAFCLGAAGVLVFLAHEPLLVVMGRRGARALREDGLRARRRLGWLGSAAIALGGFGLLTAPEMVRWLALLPIGLGLVVGGFIREGAEKTAAGELLAASTLSSVAAPIAVASGTPWSVAICTWMAWCLGLASATMAVRTVVASTRNRVALLARIAGPLVLASVGTAVAGLGLVPAFIWLAFVPTSALALGLAARPPAARHLRRIGWALVGATAFAALVLVIGARSGSPTPPSSPISVNLPLAR